MFLVLIEGSLFFMNQSRPIGCHKIQKYSQVTVTFYQKQRVKLITLLLPDSSTDLVNVAI